METKIWKACLIPSDNWYDRLYPRLLPFGWNHQHLLWWKNCFYVALKNSLQCYRGSRSQLKVSTNSDPLPWTGLHAHITLLLLHDLLRNAQPDTEPPFFVDKMEWRSGRDPPARCHNLIYGPAEPTLPPLYVENGMIVFNSLMISTGHWLSGVQVRPVQWRFSIPISGRYRRSARGYRGDNGIQRRAALHRFWKSIWYIFIKGAADGRRLLAADHLRGWACGFAGPRRFIHGWCRSPLGAHTLLQGISINTQGDNLEELKANILEAVNLSFEDKKIIYSADEIALKTGLTKLHH